MFDILVRFHGHKGFHFDFLNIDIFIYKHIIIIESHVNFNVP